MDNRSFMRKGEKITLFDEATGNKKTFVIIKRDGAGSSSVSYIASCANKTGRLKEFYPSEENNGSLLAIIRQKNNRLACSNLSQEALETFWNMRDEYVEAYRMLEDAKLKAQKGSDSFATFIPTFEILRDVGNDGGVTGSAYIWTVDNTGDFETFDSFLEKVHKHPSRNPAKVLFDILKTLYNLTECVKTLHAAGLVHSDIKPSNFGCPIRDGRYLTEQVRLFDVNSIYSVYSDFPRFSGTPGFLAPEIPAGKVTNQSDLYSIGAVLFNAVALCDDVPDGIYSDEYYDRIDDIVGRSKLINASPVTGNTHFQAAISRILKKCLAKELRKRIDNCDELKADLLAASVYLIPEQYNDALDLTKELRLIDRELESFDEADSIFAFLNLFFDHPLYENAGDTVKVLAAGFGVYGQLFVDLCLRNGQMVGKRLEVTVVTLEKEQYKKEYLANRPAMPDFFEIDGEGDTSETNYGKITFVSPEEAFGKEEGKKYEKGFRKNDAAHNKALAARLLAQCGDARYVMVALGEDALNRDAAKAFADAASRGEGGYTVAFVGSDPKSVKGAIGVNVAARASENANFDEIERMAFNAHLTWNSPLKLNVNISEVREKFLERYNHDSSVACVLSIKNILYACGVVLDDLSHNSLKRAAKEFEAVISRDRALFEALAQAEHRRWVVEKITQGWTRIEDLNECVGGQSGDRRKKRHVCLVKSRADSELNKRYKNVANGKWFKNKWDKECEDDALLDDLDMLSVSLHRVSLKAAAQIKSSYFLDGDESDRLRWLISGSREAQIAYNEWMLCLKRIWSSDDRQVRLYDGYKSVLLRKIDALPKLRRDEARSYVEMLDDKARVIMNASKMRDYKATDRDLISAVPFILTHTEHSTLFIPFMTGDNTERFNNVASVTLVNPETVVYGIYLKEPSDAQGVLDTMPHVLSYMEKKEIKSRIGIALVYKSGDERTEGSVEATVRALRELGTRIGRIAKLPVKSESQFARVISAAVGADAFEQNDAYLSALLTGAGFYVDKPSYSFSSAAKRFKTTPDCAWLGYIKSGQFITVSDMLSFNDSTGRMESFPEYGDFKELWKCFKYSAYAWKDMCRALAQHAEKVDLVTSFNLFTDLTNARTFEYVIPNEMWDGCTKVVSGLRDDAGVIGKSSRVEYNNTESCRAVFTVGANNAEAVMKLFDDPFVMTDEMYIGLAPKPKRVDVIFDSLVVRDLALGDYVSYPDRKKKICDILQTLCDRGYIYNLRISDDGTVSFVYSTRQAKKLMTNAGRILEIYVYHKLQESGFDDIVTGYEISWGDTDVKSEFDCIVTSGFRCAMIECKAQERLTQDYYYKLSCLANQFGINAVAVLIADTQEREDLDNSVNDMQRERGKMMGVVTVSDRDDINNIDMTLRRILNGNY